MSVYVSICDQCYSDATSHGLGNLLHKIKANIENNQSLSVFDSYIGHDIFKRGLSRGYRLIAARKSVDSDDLVIFLRVLPRGSNDYLDMVRNSEQINIPYSPDELPQIIESLRGGGIEVSPTPVPDQEAISWLYEVFQGRDDDQELVVLESEDWVDWMHSENNEALLGLYQRMLEDLDIYNLSKSDHNADLKHYWDEKERVGFVYLYRADLNRLLLLSPLSEQENANSVIQSISDKLDEMADGEPNFELSRISSRSYPYLMVLDRKAWFTIQKDKEYNLALSPEESDLLESIQRMGHTDNLNYPLFINGRAGSGKSTMLQYLAAGYLDFALKRNTSNVPLYMTCSSDLLDTARDTVKGLLTINHERLLRQPNDTEKIERMLGKCFVVFHDFLYAMLPEEERASLSLDKYVNYGRFRGLWEEQFSKRPVSKKIALDVAWHTIRSYIKGLAVDELTPDEFKTLSRRRKTVSDAGYEVVFSQVWEGWYKKICLEDGYWDDQDLALRVLEHDIPVSERYSAIFCDEAQDFTPIELNIIFQLSMFSGLSLQPEELRRVPFAFAGDQLQTINPTGFRWETLQADFHERFIATLDPRRNSRVEINYRELTYNYRSNPGIVKFCNLIQLLRASALQARDIGPQRAWRKSDPVQAVYFAADATLNQSLDDNHGLVKIINCEEGEEAAFVDNDDILKGLPKQGGIYRNVFGPMRAKGLEFPEVVLYRFGDSAPSNFSSLLKKEIDLDEPENRLPFEYFLNRLYVAASRAKGQLVVVDSEKALREFWGFASNLNTIDSLMKETKEGKLWNDCIAYLTPGNDGTWSGRGVDPRVQAREYEARGRLKRDPYLLDQAAMAYGSIGDNIGRGRCRAYSLSIEGQYRDAGDKYRETGEYQEAFICYWRAEDWPKINELVEAGNIASNIETRAAHFMREKSIFNPEFIARFTDAATDKDWIDHISKDPVWRTVVKEIAERSDKAPRDNKIEWPKLSDVLDGLDGSWFELDPSHLAKIHYNAGKVKKAIDIWEKHNKNDVIHYKSAKAQVTPFPGNLLYLSSLGEQKSIVEQARLNNWREQKLAPEVLGIIAYAALDQGEIGMAANVLEMAPDKDALTRLIVEASKKNENTTMVKAASSLARTYVKERDWQEAINAAEKMEFASLGKNRAKEIGKKLITAGAKAEIFSAVLLEMSMSKELLIAPKDRQNMVANFLSRHFIGKSPKKTDLGVEVIGGAIERAGKIVDALQYYEDLQKKPSSESEQMFAIKRLIKNLERHAEYFENRGDENQARLKRERATKLWKLLPTENLEIPEYPLVKPVSQGAKQEEWVEGPLKITLSRPHGRVRIEQAERFETVTILVKDAEMKGDASFETIKSKDKRLVEWHIPDWDVKVIYNSMDKLSIIRKGYDAIVVNF